MADLGRGLAEWLSYIWDTPRRLGNRTTKSREEGYLAMFPSARAAEEEIRAAPLLWSAIDRGPIEEALKLHLAALGQPDRAVRWFDSFSQALIYLAACERAARAAAKNSPIADDARNGVDDGEKSNEEESEAAKEWTWDASVLAVQNRAWSDAVDTASEDAANAAAAAMNERIPLRRSSLFRGLGSDMQYAEPDVRNNADATVRTAHRALPQDPRWNEAHEAERLSAANAALHAVEMAYAWARRSVYYECAVAPGTDATSAPGAVGRQAAEALRRAFAAGLWAFWVRDAEVVAVPAPNLHSDGRNQLHRIGGPAIEWPGEGYWFIEGGQVPPGALEIPREALAEGMTLMERWAVAQAVGVILLLWICYMFFFR